MTVRALSALAVIKVSDDTRKWGPLFQDGATSYYMGANRNETALYDVAISMLHPQGANWFMSGNPAYRNNAVRSSNRAQLHAELKYRPEHVASLTTRNIVVEK